MVKNLQCGRSRFDPCVRMIPWKRKCQPTLVFLLGEFHGQRSLKGYSPRGHKELDTTQRLHSIMMVMMIVTMTGIILL